MLNTLRLQVSFAVISITGVHPPFPKACCPMHTLPGAQPLARLTTTWSACCKARSFLLLIHSDSLYGDSLYGELLVRLDFAFGGSVAFEIHWRPSNKYPGSRACYGENSSDSDYLVLPEYIRQGENRCLAPCF